MIDIAVQELNKYYGSNHVLKGISFEVFKGEKVGLVGKNGSGKSTLFRVMSGKEGYESGNVIRAQGRIIEVLEQIPVCEAGYTVEQVLNSAFGGLAEKSEEMRALEEEIQSWNEEQHSHEMGEKGIDKLLARYGRLQTEYEALGGYEIESRIDKVCNGMKIGTAMRSQLFEKLSGGEKTRVNLAGILLRDADILLLDEPTNHLDLGTIRWVEEFLKAYAGTVIVISHDRCFLDNVVTRIVEIVDGDAEFYEGNYSYYAEEKKKRFELKSEMYEQQQRKIGQLEAAAKRLHEWARNADNPAMHKRAFSIEKRIERMDRVDKPSETRRIAAEFRKSGFSGEETAVFSDISKAYGDRQLFASINLRILRNDRIALIGDNGCGKSTLVKLLTGDEAPKRGLVRVGSSVRMAYVPQMIEFDDPEATVLETLRYALETNEEKARSLLAAFHFRGKDILKKVGSLSGGEKSRLKVCILMQGEVNFLVLDEPTNHLDIPSREWIEEAVSQFGGTILFISHDRYFINKFADRIWELENGCITDYRGSYAEYCGWRKTNGAVNAAEVAEKQPEAREKAGAEPAAKKARAAASSVDTEVDARYRRNNAEKSEAFRLKRQQDCESHIGEAESRLKSITDEMERFACDYDKLNSLYIERTQLEKELDLLYGELCSI
ncbi:MAG TPA: ABC-F type ribosomal protection protein [Clostridia bacterium]|nr:ABC-F type ribosomal protection protein [Clostridia bacterium]